MNDDLIRLSDLMPEYARCHEVSFQEAAYYLHELIESLFREYSLKRGKPLPEKIWCVGGAKFSQRPSKGYELDFGVLRKYFKALVDSPEVGSPLISCFNRTDSDYTSIPPSVVYFSKSALVEWIQAAGIEPPAFILGGNAGGCPEEAEDADHFTEKELVSIRGIVSGLIQLIKEVNNAHALPAQDDEARKRAENIMRTASWLNSSRKNFNQYPVIISLAEAAGVDLRRDWKTLKRYAEDQ